MINLGSNSSLTLRVTNEHVGEVGLFGIGFNAETVTAKSGVIFSEINAAGRGIKSVRKGNLDPSGEITREIGFLSQVELLLFTSLFQAAGYEDIFDSSDPLPEEIERLTPNDGKIAQAGRLYFSRNVYWFCEQGGSTSQDAFPNASVPNVGDVDYIGEVKLVCVAVPDSQLPMMPMTPEVRKYRLTAGRRFPIKAGKQTEPIFDLFKNTSLSKVFAYRGGRVDSLEISVASSGIAQAKWALVFLDDSLEEVTNNSVSEDGVFGSLSHEFFVSIGGGKEISASDATISITNNIAKDVYRLGKRYRHDNPLLRRECSGSMSLYFESKKLYEDFRAEKKLKLEFCWKAQDKLGATQVNRIIIEEALFFGDLTPVISGGGLILHQAEFRALEGKQRIQLEHITIGMDQHTIFEQDPTGLWLLFSGYYNDSGLWDDIAVFN